MGKSWEGWDSTAHRKVREVFLMCVNRWRESTKRTEPGSPQQFPVIEPEVMGTNWNTGVSSEHQETLYYCQGDWELPQVTQGCCRFSHLGDSPWQPDLCCSAWVIEVAQMAPKDPCLLNHALISNMDTVAHGEPTLNQIFFWSTLSFRDPTLGHLMKDSAYRGPTLEQGKSVGKDWQRWTHIGQLQSPSTSDLLNKGKEEVEDCFFKYLSVFRI